MADWDLLLTDMRIATLRDTTEDYGVIEDGALAIADGKIAWLGPLSERPANDARETRSLDNRWITPALIDCHTHLIFGGNRAAEYEQRLAGVSYEQIAAQGGGILATVNATRAAAEDELHESALRRVRQLAASGVATLEIKSGYGLDVRNELKMLAIARGLGEASGLCVQTTLLAAHTIPPEFR
ncbi:MAG: imidazolonepropionase, partial [Proteobacteria bacterium]|nr:imidazolonepropionase [Pseudomonadota bacterium]